MNRARLAAAEAGDRVEVRTRESGVRWAGTIVETGERYVSVLPDGVADWGRRIVFLRATCASLGGVHVVVRVLYHGGLTA